MATKANSKHCQTSQMKLFPQVITGCGVKLGILPPSIEDGAFSKNSQNLKAIHYLAKSPILDV